MDYTLHNMVKCVCESMGLTGKSDHCLQEQNTLVRQRDAVNTTFHKEKECVCV